MLQSIILYHCNCVAQGFFCEIGVNADGAQINAKNAADLAER